MVVFSHKLESVLNRFFKMVNEPNQTLLNAMVKSLQGRFPT